MNRDIKYFDTVNLFAEDKQTPEFPVDAKTVYSVFFRNK